MEPCYAPYSPPNLNALLRTVHNRRPVLFSDNDAPAWMNSDEIRDASSLLKPFPAELLDGYDVSDLVNNPKTTRLDASNHHDA